MHADDTSSLLWLVRLCAALLAAQLVGMVVGIAVLLWSMRARMLELLAGLARLHTASLMNSASTDSATAVAQRMTQVTASLDTSLRVLQGGREGGLPPSKRPRREPQDTLPSGTLVDPDARPSRPSRP